MSDMDYWLTPKTRDDKETIKDLRARLAEAEKRCDKYHDEYLSLCKQSADWRDKAERLEARVRELEGELEATRKELDAAEQTLDGVLRDLES